MAFLLVDRIGRKKLAAGPSLALFCSITFRMAQSYNHVELGLRWYGSKLTEELCSASLVYWMHVLPCLARRLEQRGARRVWHVRHLYGSRACLCRRLNLMGDGAGALSHERAGYWTLVGERDGSTRSVYLVQQPDGASAACFSVPARRGACHPWGIRKAPGCIE